MMYILQYSSLLSEQKSVCVFFLTAYNVHNFNLEIIMLNSSLFPPLFFLQLMDSTFYIMQRLPSLSYRMIARGGHA